MAKTISAYRGFSAATIKSRADVPDQADMTVSGTDVLCTKINTAKMRNAIGAGINAVGGLSLHANVNLWSGFGPIRRREVDGLLVNDVIAPHGMGEFAGYNHAAPVPAFNNSVHDNDIWIDSGGDADFTADITIGEPKYIGGDITNHGDCVGIVLTVWDGANMVSDPAGDGDIVELATLTTFAALTARVSGATVDKTYTCKIYLTDSLVAFNQNLDNAVCQISELANYSCTVKIKAATDWNYDGDGKTDPSGWTIPGEGLSKALGEWSCDSIYHTTGFSNIIMRVKMFNWLNEEVANEIIFSGEVLAATTYYPTVADLGMLNIPDNGYRVVIYFEEPS